MQEKILLAVENLLKVKKDDFDYLCIIAENEVFYKIKEYIETEKSNEELENFYKNYLNLIIKIVSNKSFSIYPSSFAAFYFGQFSEIDCSTYNKEKYEFIFEKILLAPFIIKKKKIINFINKNPQFFYNFLNNLPIEFLNYSKTLEELSSIILKAKKLPDDNLTINLSNKKNAIIRLLAYPKISYILLKKIKKEQIYFFMLLSYLPYNVHKIQNIKKYLNPKQIILFEKYFKLERTQKTDKENILLIWNNLKEESQDFFFNTTSRRLDFLKDKETILLRGLKNYNIKEKSANLNYLLKTMKGYAHHEDDFILIDKRFLQFIEKIGSKPFVFLFSSLRRIKKNRNLLRIEKNQNKFPIDIDIFDYLSKDNYSNSTFLFKFLNFRIEHKEYFNEKGQISKDGFELFCLINLS